MAASATLPADMGNHLMKGERCHGSSDKDRCQRKPEGNKYFKPHILQGQQHGAEQKGDHAANDRIEADCPGAVALSPDTAANQQETR